MWRLILILILYSMTTFYLEFLSHRSQLYQDYQGYQDEQDEQDYQDYQEYQDYQDCPSLIRRKTSAAVRGAGSPGGRGAEVDVGRVGEAVG